MKKEPPQESSSNEAWIDVKERPKIDKNVLLFNGHWIGVGQFHPDENFDPEESIDEQILEPSWRDEVGEYIYPEPTHWMPLPKPPKQTDDK